MDSVIANLEAEQAVLGAVILEPTTLDKIEWLPLADFASERNSQLLDYFRYLYECGMPISLVHVAENMKQIGKSDQEIMDMVSYFQMLSGKAVTAANVEHYAEVVQRVAVRRRAAEHAKHIQQLAQSGELTESEFLAEIENGAEALRPKNKTGLVHVKDTRTDFFHAMNTPDDFIKTGSTAFDNWGGGYARKSLIIKAGRPGVGKTAEAIQDVLGIAEQKAGNCAIFSQEMTGVQVKQRMISCKSGINYTRIRRKWVMGNDDERQKMEQAYTDIQKLPLYISDSSGLTIQEVRADCRRLVREHGKLAVILLDYLTLLKITVGKGETKPSAIGSVVWQCKMMAKEFDCPFILVCMMRRSDDSKEPTMNDLKESGDIEQHADMIEFLWVDPTDEESTAGKIITRTIAKGRDTGTGKLKYLFKGHVQRFEDTEVKKKEKKRKNQKESDDM